MSAHVLLNLLNELGKRYKNYWLCDRCVRELKLKKSAAINDVNT